MSVIESVLLLTGGVLTGLIAGLFYSYSCSVNLGLGKLNDIEYLRAMQSINREILNPVFFLSFMGTLLILPICTLIVFLNEDISRFYLFLSASLFYGIGVFGVTIMGNVPLNQQLDKFDISGVNESELIAQRKRFEGPWNRFHLIRTICVVITLMLVIYALLI